MTKSPDAFRTISEVADWLGVPAHVLRFWESKFAQVKPVKRAGGRRYYRPADMQLLGGIKSLLHNDGMTIKGVQKMLREQGIATVSSYSQPLDADLEDSSVVEARVLPFKTRAASPSSPDLPDDDDTPEPEVAQEPPAAPSATPHLEAERAPASPVQDAGEPAASTSPEPARAESEGPKLPSFLHRNRPDETAKPDRPRARVVDAPDPPPEAELDARPGALSRLGAFDTLTQAQLRDLAPIAQSLRAWLDRTTGARAS